MSRKLEELLGLAPAETYNPPTQELDDPDDHSTALVTAQDTLAMLNAALPQVRALEKLDTELDDLAAKALRGYEDLSDLAMNVDSRFAAEISSVAASMFGHALSAKTAKMTRQMRTVEMQMKKVRLEMDMLKRSNVSAEVTTPLEVAEGQVLSRNELMRMLAGDRGAGE